ncbi:hypothetical protein V6N13_077081 [Hibiscus sabdariffa]
MNNSGAAVEVTKDRNGTDQVLLRNPRGASARVSLHGGQVLSWRTDRGEELLFTSSKAIFKPPYAVRGGIPICFPQFGQRGSLEQHGFARNRTWIIDENPPPLHPNDSDGKAYIDLLLKPSEDDLKIWPHSTLASKLKNCFSSIVCNNQSVYISGKSIIDNVLLAKELVRGYGEVGGICLSVSA